MRAFTRYVGARLEQKSLETAYRVYVTDALKIIGENTAHFAGGSTLEKRYIDLLDPPKEETRTADEVIAHIKGKLAGVS